jgi:hypothetical protein
VVVGSNSGLTLDPDALAIGLVDVCVCGLEVVCGLVAACGLEAVRWLVVLVVGAGATDWVCGVERCEVVRGFRTRLRVGLCAGLDACFARCAPPAVGEPVLPGVAVVVGVWLVEPSLGVAAGALGTAAAASVVGPAGVVAAAGVSVVAGVATGGVTAGGGGTLMVGGGVGVGVGVLAGGGPVGPPPTGGGRRGGHEGSVMVRDGSVIVKVGLVTVIAGTVTTMPPPGAVEVTGGAPAEVETTSVTEVVTALTAPSANA